MYHYKYYYTFSSYFLTIMVSDNGNPVRSASTTVSISLMDINDNRPQFVNLDPPPEITVKEVLFDIMLLLPFHLLL